MEIRLRQRLVGAIVLVTLLVIFVPIVFKRTMDKNAMPMTVVANIPATPGTPGAPDAMILQPDQLNSQAALPGDKMQSAKSALKLKSVPATAWVVQLGSFADRTHAQVLQKQLQQHGFTAYIRSRGNDFGSKLAVVYVGPETKRSNAEALLARLDTEMQLKGMVINFDPLHAK